jgi:tetratricopeptide (TPR) repeat protein
MWTSGTHRQGAIESSVRWLAALSLLLSAAACGGGKTTPLPELPVPKSDTFLPAVRDQIDGAYKRAAARPGDAEAVGRYGMALDAYAQYELARVCYERAHRLDPRSFSWGYHLALLQNVGSDRAPAIATLREALKLRPDYLPGRLALASMLLDSGAADESRALAESAVKDAPRSARAHYALGRALAALRRHADAAERFRDALSIAPGYAAAHYALALAYRDLGTPAEGERHMALYQKSPEAGPPIDDPLIEEVERLNQGSLVHLRQAEQLYNQSRFPEAAEEYDRALALQGEDKTIHTALVATYLRMKAWDKAEAHYRAAVAIDPAFSKAHFNIALVRTQRGDYPGALAALQKALAADPTDAATHTQLGQVYELLHEPAKAVRHFRLALEADPHANQTRALLVNRLLADARGREALDELLQLLVAGDVRPEVARAAVRRTYPRVGSPRQVAGYLRDARQRAAAAGRTDLVAAIEIEITALQGVPP